MILSKLNINFLIPCQLYFKESLKRFPRVDVKEKTLLK